MYSILQTIHSWWAVLTILSLFNVVISSIVSVSIKRQFGNREKVIALISLIIAHVQLFVGFALYFVSPLGLESFGQMSVATLRLTSLEHPFVVLIAIVLITLGFVKQKNATDDAAKYKKIAIYYGAGLILILSRIPWSLWF